MLKFKNIVLMILGNLLLAYSVQAFIIPYDIPVGGVTGLALILSHLSMIDMETIVLIINCLCLPIAYFYSSKELMFGSLLSSFMYPLCLTIVDTLPKINTFHSLFLATLFSGLISGIGVGLVLKVNASTGGLDIVSIVLSDKLNLNISLVMYLMDTMLMIGQLFFIDFISIFYGILGALIMTRMIHKVIH